MIRRRDLITLIGGMTVARAPIAQAKDEPRRIGILNRFTRDPANPSFQTFKRVLAEAGMIEGSGIAIEVRSANGQDDRLPALAAELVAARVAVIVPMDGTPGALAAKATTTTVPIIFNIGGDPVRLGLVVSLNRPGGNVSGVTILTVQLTEKQVELLDQLIPRAAPIAMLANPRSPNAVEDEEHAKKVAASIGRSMHVERASTATELDNVFASMASKRVTGVVVNSEPFFISQRDHIVALTTQYSIAAIFGGRDFATAGGFVSYGPNFEDAWRQAARYVVKVLNGTNPGDLPVVQANTFELVINLKTAKALGITIPPTLLARADEVIE